MKGESSVAAAPGEVAGVGIGGRLTPARALQGPNDSGGIERGLADVDGHGALVPGESRWRAGARASLPVAADPLARHGLLPTGAEALDDLDRRPRAPLRLPEGAHRLRPEGDAAIVAEVLGPGADPGDLGGILPRDEAHGREPGEDDREPPHDPSTPSGQLGPVPAGFGGSKRAGGQGRSSVESTTPASR
jgi:hypothetical protein